MDSNESKICIYQMLVRLFGNKNPNFKIDGSIHENGVGKFADVNERALLELRKLGITHIWYTGVIEHATRTDYTRFGITKDHPAVVKGNAGSPYAIRDYYDVCPDLAVNVDRRMEEFEELVARTKGQGLKVIIDFVPNHVARTYKSDRKPKGMIDFGEKDDVSEPFSPQNNFYYIPGHALRLPDELEEHDPETYREFPAKATGNGVFSPYPRMDDWYETIKLNYGIDFANGWAQYFDPMPRTWAMMRDILLFWADKGVDGFRCDMAEIVPIEFWAWVIPQVKRNHPQIIFIAEIYKVSLYHAFVLKGQFDFLYDKVDMYDTIRAVMEGTASANAITNCWQVQEGLERHMLRFLENHDEHRVASKQFAGDAYMGIPGMAVIALMSRGPVMIYFGQEVGEPASEVEGFSGADGRTSIFDYCTAPEHQKWMSGGAFDGRMLSLSQKKLRMAYKNILTICHKYEAFRKGGFYDLQYLNQNHAQFTPEFHYAFIRHYKGQALLVVSNFDRWHGYDMRVKLAPQVFSHIGLDPNKPLLGRELLGSEQSFSIHPQEAAASGLPMTIAAKRAVVFELWQA